MLINKIIINIIYGDFIDWNVTSGYITQLNDVKLKLNASENFIKTSTLKINHLQQQMESDQMKLTKAKTENETLLSAIELHRQFIKTNN